MSKAATHPSLSEWYENLQEKLEALEDQARFVENRFSAERCALSEANAQLCSQLMLKTRKLRISTKRGKEAAREISRLEILSEKNTGEVASSRAKTKNLKSSVGPLQSRVEGLNKEKRNLKKALRASRNRIMNQNTSLGLLY